MPRLYFETSAVNYLLDKLSDNSISSLKANRKLSLENGTKWQISNVTLWEIFLTKNEARRHQLFDFSRSLFHDNLISSLEEIVVNYVRSGCPIHEIQYEVDSETVFSKEWKVACKNPDYTFEPDRQQLNNLTTHYRFLGEYFIKTNNGYLLHPHRSLDKVSNRFNKEFLKHIHESILKLCSEIDKETIDYIARAMQVVMIIFCFGIGFDQQTIERFWNTERRIEPFERLELTVDKFPDIFFRGPLSNLTKMILLQSKNKTGRGLYFDSLQSIYITYSDLFFTNDTFFKIQRRESK